MRCWPTIRRENVSGWFSLHETNQQLYNQAKPKRMRATHMHTLIVSIPLFQFYPQQGEKEISCRSFKKSSTAHFLPLHRRESFHRRCFWAMLTPRKQPKGDNQKSLHRAPFKIKLQRRNASSLPLKSGWFVQVKACIVIFTTSQLQNKDRILLAGVKYECVVKRRLKKAHRK